MRQGGGMKRILIVGLAAAVLAAGIWFAQRPKAHFLTLTGTVDGNEVVVGAQITGRIERLAVEDGQRVQAGQLLATLDQGVQAADAQAASDAIAAAQASTRQSEAQTRLLAGTLAAKAKQAEAQQAQAHAQLAQAQAQSGQAQANWDKAEANYRRIVPLAARGVSSPLELDNAKADVDAASASRQSAQAGIEAAERNIAAADAALNDARDQQTQALEASARQAQASRQAAMARLGQTEVLAPVSGIITLRAAREGEVVNPGNPIVTIFQLEDTWVDADVEETYAPAIAINQLLQVRLADGTTLTGPVIYKAVEADFATQRDVSRTKRDIKTVAIRVKVPNPDGRLALGMTAWV